MTVKAVALLKRRDDISHAEFVDYYETRHVPLILSLLPGIAGYTRNYADFSEAITGPDASPFDFDVVTELWFDDRAAYDAAMAVAATPGVAAKIAEDESHFLVSAKTRFFVAEERRSSSLRHLEPVSG